jgi:hypothetical protein
MAGTSWEDSGRRGNSAPLVREENFALCRIRFFISGFWGWARQSSGNSVNRRRECCPLNGGTEAKVRGGFERGMLYTM